MDTSSEKPVKSRTSTVGHCYKRETLRESKSHQITAENNALRTNNVKVKVDEMPKKELIM